MSHFHKFQYFFSFDGDKFQETDDSYFDHSETFGLGNYRGKAFTTGCSPKSSEWDSKDWRGDKSSCKRRTEIMDMWDGGYWRTRHEIENLFIVPEQIPDYPFATGDKYVFHVS